MLKKFPNYDGPYIFVPMHYCSLNIDNIMPIIPLDTSGDDRVKKNFGP